LVIILNFNVAGFNKLLVLIKRRFRKAFDLRKPMKRSLLF